MRVFLTTLITLFLALQSASADFQAGAAMRIVTPDPLLPISGGMGPNSPAKEKKGELTARAVVFQNGQTTVAIVSVDFLGFPGVLCDRVRAQVDRIPAENILIGATHGHSSPDVYAFPDGRGGHTGDLAYIDSVCNKAAEAINEAIDNLKPASLKIATGEAEGKIAFNYYAPQLYDPRMSVIQATSPDGNVIATLVNYAIHPEVLGAGVGILSPDLIGPLCDKLEADVGGMAIFINGAQGGMVTADNRDFDRIRDPKDAYWNGHRTWDECLRIGHLMANEAQRILGDAQPQENPKLTCEHSDVTFPVDSKELWATVKMSPLNYPHNDDQTVTSRINYVRLGDAKILTIPGEALPNIGFFLKRKLGGEHTLLFGLTNDAFGYILTQVDFNSFSRYDYVSRTSLGEMTGEILIKESLKLINSNSESEHHE